MRAAFALALALVAAPALAGEWTTWRDPTASGGAWSNASNTYASDNSRASTAVSGDTLCVSGFGFASEIPPKSTILGIEVSVEGYAVNAGLDENRLTGEHGDQTTCSFVGDQNKDFYLAVGSGNENYQSYGSSADTWGAPTIAALARDTNFGVALQNLGEGNFGIYVDHVQMRIYFERPRRIF